MKETDLRALSSQEKLVLLKRAIGMIKRGVKKREVSIQLSVNKNTITSWWKLYREKGTQSYRYGKPGVKSEDRKLLTTRQEEFIQEKITDTMPDQLKLDFALWTRKAVQELIEREFSITIAVRTVGDYLKKWGFTPQKPKKRAYEQCPKKVQKGYGSDN